MNLKTFFYAGVIMATLFFSSAARPEPAQDPLAGFVPFIGGQWHMEGSYTELEWGVSRQSVKARSYFVVDGHSKLVSEGFWYWHPGERQIKGIFTAIDMPVVLFVYTMRFEGAAMIGDLKAFAANGKETEFIETWKLVDDSHFAWTLSSMTADGQEQSMSGTYTRRMN